MKSLRIRYGAYSPYIFNVLPSITVYKAMEIIRSKYFEIHFALFFWYIRIDINHPKY